MKLSSLGIALLGAGLLATGRAQDRDLAKQLADTQDKLSTALHSYTLIADENARLKSDAERSAAEIAAAQRTIESLRGAAAASAQLDPLRTQVRQLQDQVADLAQQNYELKNRLAAQGSAPQAKTQ